MKSVYVSVAVAFLLVCLTLTGCDAFKGNGAADLNRGISDAETRLVALEAQLEESKAAAARALADAKADAAKAASAMELARSVEETLLAQQAKDAAAQKEREAAALASKSNQVQDSVRQLQEALATAKATLETAMRPDGSVDVGAAAAGIGATLGPWGMLGGTLIGIAWGVYERSQKNRVLVAEEQNLKSVSIAVDRVSNQHPELSKKLDEVWPQFEEALTPKAREVINSNSVT